MVTDLGRSVSGTMQYRVRYVSDDLLPAGKKWALCRDRETVLLCIARSVRSLPEEEAEEVLTACWAGYRAQAERWLSSVA